MGERLAEETALPADRLDVKARLASEEYKVASLENDRQTRKEQMNNLLGRDVAFPFSVAPLKQAPAEEVDLRSALDKAQVSRPDLAQARLAVEQAETDRRMKGAESIPDLNLAFSYTSYVNVDLLPRNVAIVGVQLKWQPFDWGRRGKEKAEKELLVEQARSQVREAESQAHIDVAFQHRKLQEARLLLEATRLGREAANEKLRVVVNRHKEEAALVEDVLRAEAAVSGANADYEQALMTFWSARADLSKAMGEEL
jgi:outer membrane protein TolC